MQPRPTLATHAFAVWILAQSACGTKPEGDKPVPQTKQVSMATPAAVSEAQRARVTAQAEAALAPFKKGLASALGEALQQGGALAAIDVCKEAAPRLARAASTDEVTLGRAALKLRNPANAAQPWLAPILAGYARDEANRASVVVPIAKHRFGYAQPIILQAACTVCHGPAVSPELALKLRESYPDDQATGFVPGDLRGVLWAEVRLPE